MSVSQKQASEGKPTQDSAGCSARECWCFWNLVFETGPTRALFLLKMKIKPKSACWFMLKRRGRAGFWRAGHDWWCWACWFRLSDGRSSWPVLLDDVPVIGLFSSFITIAQQWMLASIVVHFFKRNLTQLPVMPALLSSTLHPEQILVPFNDSRWEPAWN